MSGTRKARTLRGPVLRRRLQNMMDRLEAECATLDRLLGPTAGADGRNHLEMAIGSIWVRCALLDEAERKP